MKMGFKRWLRKEWKGNLFRALLLVSGGVYAWQRLDKLWEKGMVLRGGLIEGVFLLFCVTAAAVVIVFGSVWLSRVLVVRYRGNKGECSIFKMSEWDRGELNGKDEA